MNNEMAINPYLSTIESKKLNKQNRNRLRYREHFDGCQMGKGWGVGEKDERIKK